MLDPRDRYVMHALEGRWSVGTLFDFVGPLLGAGALAAAAAQWWLSQQEAQAGAWVASQRHDPAAELDLHLQFNASATDGSTVSSAIPAQFDHPASKSTIEEADPDSRRLSVRGGGGWSGNPFADPDAAPFQQTDDAHPAQALLDEPAAAEQPALVAATAPLPQLSIPPTNLTAEQPTGTETPALEGPPSDSSATDVRPTPGSLPLDFVVNTGQWDPAIRFAAGEGDIAAAFEQDAIQLRMNAGGADQSPTSLRIAFEGASPDANLLGESQREGRYNFFIGNDPDKWRSDVPTFASVRYDEMYDGVDVRVRNGGGGTGSEAKFEYDLLLEPGADLDGVIARVDGATRLELDGNDLLVHTDQGVLRQSAPVTWEVLPDGKTRPVQANFRILENQRFGFEAPGWSGTHELVVDPGLDWSTFLGGNDGDEPQAIAVPNDGTGDVVVAGYTMSPDFPVTTGAWPGSSTASYIARFNSTGTALKYATVFGSPTHYAWAYDLALDASGAPVITGITRAGDLPTTPNAYDRTYGGSSGSGDDVFVARFNATGSQLVFSTYLGTSEIPDPTDPVGFRGGYEEAHEVAVDAAGNVIVAGWTQAADFPTTPGAYDRIITTQVDSSRAGSDLFLSRFSPDGSALTYSTFIGGQGGEAVNSLVVDANGFVTLGGLAWPQMDANFNAVGTPYPTTPDAVQRHHNGNYTSRSDMILSRLKLDGAGAADLKYSTIIGGWDSEAITGIAVSPSNPEMVAFVGYTRSWDFRTTPGVLMRTPVSPQDWEYASVGMFRFPAAGGGQLAWNTFIGGNGFQRATDVTVDAAGNPILVGWGNMDFPTTDRAYDRVSVSRDAVIARISSDGKRVLYGTLLGGQGDDGYRDHVNVAYLGGDSVAVAGITFSTDFPTTPGAYDRIINADGTTTHPVNLATRNDTFAARLTLQPNPTTDTSAAAPALVSPATGAQFPAPTFENNTVPVLFDWSDVADESGVQLYQIEISPDPEFGLNRGNVAEWIVRETTVSQYEANFTHWLGHQGRYFWRVRTLDNQNNWSSFSSVRMVNLGNPNFQRLSHVKFATDEVTGGNTVQVTVTIQDRLAPAGGVPIFLQSGNTAVATVPSSVVIPSGSDRATFTVTTKSVSNSTPVWISVAEEQNVPVTRQWVLWVDPGVAAPASLSAVSVNPSSVNGGTSATGTVTLTTAAPAGGLIVSLSSSNTAAANVPASVTVPAGATSANFTVTTSSVVASTPVTLTASAAGVTRTTTLSVNPVAAGPSLTALSLTPSTVSGGATSQGRVTLSAAAPAGGIVVTLSSANTAIATVPASVTVPAGATSATFTVTSKTVSTQSSVLISATRNGVTRSATLTVNPVAADTVSISRAEYKSGNRELRVEARSSSSNATLKVYVTSTNQLIGTLRNNGGGSYGGTFSWSVNPQNITVRSSLGGSASRAVTLN